MTSKEPVAQVFHIRLLHSGAAPNSYAFKKKAGIKYMPLKKEVKKIQDPYIAVAARWFIPSRPLFKDSYSSQSP